MTTVAQSIPMLDLSPETEELWDELRAATERVMRSGAFILGEEVAQFEQEMAAYLGVKHAIGVNSGTDALVIALRALGIAAGDEVITTPFSFFATAEAISMVGATPVFVDIVPESFNINPELLEAAITERTRAVMPVHLYGNPVAMTRLMAMAEKHNLRVIEDCAQSVGARYRGDCAGCNATCSVAAQARLLGKCTGSLGDFGAFSFYPTKNLGAFGDGGLITTNDDLLAEQATMLRQHGAKKRYHNEILGYNSRLDSMQAAILRVKLPHIDRRNAERRRAAAVYNDLLAGSGQIITPQITAGHVFHQYTVRLLDSNRDEIQAALQARGISTIVYYPIPQDQLPVYQGQYPAQPVSMALAKEVLSLPLWPSIDPDTQARVAEALLELL